MTHDEAYWVAHLARLNLSQAEVEEMTPQLSAIVDYVRQLQKIDTEGVEPLAHAHELHTVFRDDVPAPSLTVDAALANAPNRKDAFFSVPAVLDS